MKAPADEVNRSAVIAIQFAFHDDQRGFERLEDYLEDMSDADLEDLWQAARTLDGAIGNVLGRRHS